MGKNSRAQLLHKQARGETLTEEEILRIQFPSLDVDDTIGPSLEEERDYDEWREDVLLDVDALLDEVDEQLRDSGDL